jgi:polyisoprenoid-binding protein YceI
MSTENEPDWFAADEAEGQQAGEQPGTPVAAPQPAQAAPAGVRAQAQTTDGWPVGTAVLTITDATGNQVARAAADADGRLASAPLPPGTYTAIVTAPGFGPLARTAVVTASGTAVLGVLPMTRSGGVDLPKPGTWTIDPAHSSISVTARHLGIASVRGRFGEFAGKVEVAEPVEQSAVVAAIQAASIDTGNSMRDNHLRTTDFLSAETHPTIDYVGTGITPLGGEKWRVDGKLTLNGVTRPVPLELTYLGVGDDPWGGTRVAFHAVTELKQQDFAITYNQVIRAGITAIGTTLRVELDVEAVRGDSLPSM